MSTPTPRAWTDADRELVVRVLWTRALTGGNAGTALDLQPAADAPQHLWADAAAVLDALAAAGWEPRCDCDGVAHDLPILRSHVRGEPGCTAHA